MIGEEFSGRSARRRILRALDAAGVTDRTAGNRDELAERVRCHLQDDVGETTQRSVADLLGDAGLGRPYATMLLGAAGDAIAAYWGTCEQWPTWCAEETVETVDDGDELVEVTLHRRWTAAAEDGDRVLTVGVVAIGDDQPGVVVVASDGDPVDLEHGTVAEVALSVPRTQVLVEGLHVALEVLGRQAQPRTPRGRAGAR